MRYFRITTIMLCTAALFALTGCGKSFFPRGAEITEFEIVRVIGFDKCEENPDHVEVTIVAERPAESPEEGFGGVSHEIASAAGQTAFEAVLKLRSRIDKKQTFGYVDYIIFGEDAVRDNLAKYADYPARSPEFRFSPKVFVARGSSAKELLNAASSADMLVMESLDNLKQNVNERSDVKLVRYIELMQMLNRSDVAAILPAVRGEEPDDEKLLDGELPEKKLTSAGYAVVRDFRLAGWFDSDEAQGYNFLTGNVKTCAYSVSDGYGGYAALDVLGVGVSIHPRFRGNHLTGVTFEIDVSAAVTEQQTQINLQTYEGAEFLSAQLTRAIEDETRTVIEKSQQLGIDCFDLAGKIKMRHPYKWRSISQDWCGIYGSLDINVVANAKVRRMYNLREPNGYNTFQHAGWDY